MFHGAVSFDSAGSNTPSMMYPATNAAVMLAGVLTHALITSSINDREKDQFQLRADSVVAPYRPILSAFPAHELYVLTAARTRSPGPVELLQVAQAAASSQVVDVAPVFVLAQDQKALMLETRVSVSVPGAVAAQSIVVRVVSDATLVDAIGPDPSVYWSAEDGVHLKGQSAELLARAIDVALATRPPVDGKNDKPFQTFRYFEGSTERMERGQLVDESCGHLVIRTLRGILLSVQSGTRALADECPKTASAH